MNNTIPCVKCDGILGPEYEAHGHKGGDYYRNCMSCKEEYAEYEYRKYHNLSYDEINIIFIKEKNKYIKDQISRKKDLIEFAKQNLATLKKEILELESKIK